MRAHLERAGLQSDIEIDSAGTHAYHVGAPPDERARRAAAVRGYDLSALRARHMTEFDFVRFDHILAMDQDNLTLLRKACPAEHRHKLGLLLEYSPNFSEREVPDPYYGGADGFEHVLDLVEDAASGLIDKLARK